MAQLKGGTTIAGSEAWHAGNDGAGSGLDADLLDGQSGTYYYPASNPNGYTNNQSASEILTAIKTVDGAGSGLDADLLDGYGHTTLPVSSAQQTALDLKAPLSSPTLTGVPTAPTVAQGVNTTQIATTAYTISEITAALTALSYVTPTSVQALHATDTLRISGTSISLYKGDGTAESVTLPTQSAPTTTQIGDATAGLVVGAKGSYALLMPLGTDTYGPGAVLAGSSLDYAGASEKTGDLIASATVTTTSPGGSWRCMGYSKYVQYDTDNKSNYRRSSATLWLRYV